MLELTNEMNQTYFKAFAAEGGKYLHVEWTGYAVPLEEIINGINAEGRICSENNIKAILSDHTKVYGSWAHANEWIESHGLSILVNAGFNKYAQVVSKDAFAQLASQELKLIFEKKVQLKFFEDIDSAKKWIVE
jgi:hypothetical protein